LPPPLPTFVAMTIEKHISALLYRYQCVTVPAFGAFLTEVRAARLDAASHTFYPPVKVVSFNANVKNNDGLLANHIAQQEKISYDAAVSAIATTVQEWKATLENLDIIFLKNIGQMGLNAEGSLVFTPDTPVNYLAEAFGLGKVVSAEIKREVYKAEVEALEERAPIAFTPQRRRNFSVLKYAAVFALVAGTGTVAFKNYYDYKIAADTLAVQNSVQAKVEQHMQSASFMLDPLPAVMLPVKKEVINLPYHVVAGAYKSAENAETAVAGLIKAGYKAHRLELNKHNLYPVVYGSFETYEAARQSMNEIHSTGDKDAWLLIQ